MKYLRFDLHHAQSVNFSDSETFIHNADTKEKKKFEQLAEYSLFGNIASIKAVRIGNNQRDSLILSFRDAKVMIHKHDISLIKNIYSFTDHLLDFALYIV